jgi:hypothetical protein
MVGGAAFLLTSKTKLQLAFWIVLAGIVTFVVLFASERPPLTSVGWIRVVWITGLLVLIFLRLKWIQRFDQRVALGAFALLFIYWGALWGIHKVALTRGEQLAMSVAQSHGETVLDYAVMPTLSDPTHWQLVFETDAAAYRLELFLNRAAGNTNLVRQQKIQALDPPIVERVLEDRRAKIFLDFARFPVARIQDTDCVTQALVQLADLRYTEPGSRRGTFALELPVECPTQNPIEKAVNGRNQTDLNP